MHSRFLPLLLIGSSMLAGCTSMQKSSFKEMSAAYREVVEQYSNDNILLNIVRSSRNMPMSFLDIPTVAGSGTWSASPGTQRFLSDYTFTNNNYFSHSLGLSVSNSFTFQQASLDNAQFMSAFYKEIDLESINFKGTEQRLPKAIIYTLLIDSIELHSSDKFQIQKWVNDPLLPNYRAFQSALNVMIDVGLTTELVSYKSPIGPPFSAEEFTKNLGPWTTALANNKAGALSMTKSPLTIKPSISLTAGSNTPDFASMATAPKNCSANSSLKQRIAQILPKLSFRKVAKPWPFTLLLKCKAMQATFNLPSNFAREAMYSTFWAMFYAHSMKRAPNSLPFNHQRLQRA